MAEKRVSVRLVASGGQRVRAELEGIGKAGKQSFGRMRGDLDVVNARLAAFARKVRIAAAASAAAAAATAASMVRSGLRTIDAQAKLAQSLDTTVASIQALERAGELAGVSMGQIEQATLQLTRRLSQASAGTGPAVEALDRLGLSAQSLQKIALDKRLALIQDALAKMVPQAERAGVAARLFGDRAGLVFARIDSATLRQATQDLRDFGVAVSEHDGEQIERTNDALSRLGLAWTGVSNRMAIAAAPALESIANASAGVVKYFDDIVVAGAALTFTLTTVGTVLTGTTAAAGLATAAMTALRVAMLAIPHLAIAAGIATLVNRVRNLKDETLSLNDALNRLGVLDARVAILRNDLSGSVLSTMEGLARAEGEKDAIAYARGFMAQIATQGEDALNGFWNQYASSAPGSDEAALQAFGFDAFASQAEAAGVAANELRQAFAALAANSTEAERRAERFMHRALTGLRNLQEETGLGEAALRSLGGALDDLRQAGGAGEQFAALEQLRDTLTGISREGLGDAQVQNLDALLGDVVALQDKIRPLAELVGDPRDTTRQVADLELAMRALANATGDLPGSIDPGTAQATAATRQLRRELEVAERAKRSLASVDAARSIVATADAARALAGHLGLAADQAVVYDAMLAAIGNSNSFGQQASALADVLQYLERTADGASAVDREARAVYESLLKALGVAISFESAIAGSSEQARQLAGRLGQAASQMAGFADSAKAALKEAQLRLEFRDDPVELARQLSLARSSPGIDAIKRDLAAKGFVASEIRSRTADLRDQAQATADIAAETARINVEMRTLDKASRGASRGVSEHAADAGRWIERTRTASERLADELRDLAELNELGFFSEHPQAYARAVALVNEEFAKTEFAGFYKGIESISDALVGVIAKGESLRKAFSRVLQTMASEILSSNIKGLLADMLNPTGGGAGGLIGRIVNGLFGGGFDFGAGGGLPTGSNIPIPTPRPSVLHDGGIAGLSGSRRAVPALAFAHAPRLHGGGWPGLRPDEVPAILERGERVLAKNEASRYGRLRGEAVLRIEVPEGFSAEQVGQINGIAINITKAAFKQYDSNIAPRVRQVVQDPRRIG